MQQITSLPSSSMAESIERLENAILRKFGQEGAMTLSKYNPDFLQKERLSIDDCHFGDYPTLAELDKQFNGRFSAAWLMAHLHDLSEYCGCRDKLAGQPLRQCASIIASEYYYLKVTELMLFFNRFKLGRYGRFYGSVDPLVITTSLQTFVDERLVALRKHESEQRDREMEEWRKNAVSYEAWLAMQDTSK